MLLWEEEKTQPISSVLKKAERPEIVMGMIGPEGGFSKDEVERLKKGGFVSVSLGRRVLRAETAAIIFVGIIQYEIGDMGLLYNPQ